MDAEVYVNNHEVEVYIPVLNDRNEKISEKFAVIPFMAHCPTMASTIANDVARGVGAEFYTFGRRIARDAQGMPDYNPKRAR